VSDVSKSRKTASGKVEVAKELEVEDEAVKTT